MGVSAHLVAPRERRRPPAARGCSPAAAHPRRRLRGHARRHTRGASPRQRRRAADLRGVRGRGPRPGRRPQRHGGGPGRPGRGPDQVRHPGPVRRDHGGAPRRVGVRPGGRRGPRRARPPGVRGGRGGRRRRQRPRRRPAPATCPREDRRTGGPRRRRVGDLHVGIHRYAEGRRRVAPVRRRLRRRRVATVPPGRPAGTAGPGDGRAVGRLRRVVRGDVARVGARRLPGPGTAVAGPQRGGRRAVAARQRHHRRVHRPDAGHPVAHRVPGRGPAPHPRWRGLPTRDRSPAGPRRARGLEHLRAHRGDRRLVRRAAGPGRAGADRAAARRLGPRRRGRGGSAGAPRGRR